MKLTQMIFALFLGFFLANPGTASAEGKIAFVNLQRAVEESAAGKAALAEFQTYVANKRTEIEADQKSLTTLQEDIERKAVVMNEDEKRKLVREFEDKQIDFRRKVEEAQVDLQARQQTVYNELGGKVKQEVLKLGTSGGYTAILDSGAALYSDSASDVTDQIIKAFDANNG